MTNKLLNAMLSLDISKAPNNEKGKNQLEDQLEILKKQAEELSITITPAQETNSYQTKNIYTEYGVSLDNEECKLLLVMQNMQKIHTRIGKSEFFKDTVLSAKLDSIRKALKEGAEKYFFLCGIANEDPYSEFRDYIVSIEFASFENLERKTSDFNLESTKEFQDIETLIKKKPNYMRVRLTTKENDYGHLVFIKIKEANGYTFQYLKDYFICSDNRTYKGTRGVPYYKDMKSVECDMRDQYARNLLIHGAPGTGKSHYIDEKIDKIFQLNDLENLKRICNDPGLKEKFAIIKKGRLDPDSRDRTKTIEPDPGKEDDQRLVKDIVKSTYLTRVTFYEDYTYESFVGCYKPKKAGDGRITYEYEPGPFIETYAAAVNHPKKPYFLVIEEINRAKAATVFGDMFQLLDRDNEGNSEYTIKPEASLDKYLSENLESYDGVMRIPPNMYIWATMNSADQGVNVLDSAFKRRWEHFYKDLDSGINMNRTIILPYDNAEGGKEFYWDTFRIAINTKLLEAGIEEDRCIGPYFFKDKELNTIKEFFADSDMTSQKTNPLVDKLFAYLLQDVVKLNPGILFHDKYQNMTALRKAFTDNGPKNITDILRIQPGTPIEEPNFSDPGAGDNNE